MSKVQAPQCVGSMSGVCGQVTSVSGPAVIDFKRVLRGRLCILGIGNRERGDDGAGSVLAESLSGMERAIVIDAGAVPENYLEKTLAGAPETIVIVDAIDFGAPAGSVRVIEPGCLGHVGVSSHALSLAMAVEYLSRRSDAEVVVIGIQPTRLGNRTTLSAAVARGVAALREQLLGFLEPASKLQET